MSYLFPSSQLTFEAALRDIASARGNSRVLAAQALGNVTDATEKRRAVEALIVALEDDLPEVRMEAAGSLGELRDTSALAALIKRLDDGVAVVRQHAAIALGTVGSEEAFAALVEAIESGPADLRFQAVTSLTEIDPARAYDHVLKALGDRDGQVVAAAALSLGAIGDARAIPALTEQLEAADSATRFDIAYALTELKNAAGRERLVAGLSDAERSWDAVTALATLGAPDDIEALGKALISRHTPPEAATLAAGKLIALDPTGVHGEAARKLLLANLTSRKAHLRGLAIEQLGAVAGAWAKAPLDKLARSGKGSDFHEAIAAALAQIDARDKQGATS